jgi:antitoxin component of RelBE/YafQ-DinJ toxin-antitoxin module
MYPPSLSFAVTSSTRSTAGNVFSGIGMTCNSIVTGDIKNTQIAKYQSFPFLSQFKRNTRAKIPAIQLINAPRSNIPVESIPVDSASNKSLQSASPPRIMIGIDKINENAAASSRLSRQHKAATMVEPDREMPGKIAIACTQPIMRASRHVIVEVVFSPSGKRSV